jgi:hypothetical protein
MAPDDPPGFVVRTEAQKVAFEQADYGFETFGALKPAEMHPDGGKFTSRELILLIWDELPAPQRVPATLSGQRMSARLAGTPIESADRIAGPGPSQ